MTVCLPQFSKSSTFFNPLVQIRHRMGISRAKLCEKTGMSYTTATQAELGRSLIASPVYLEALARLGVDVSGLPELYVRWRSAR
jgi:transcriptional regulator with XRE-family HTH domain